MGAHTRAWGYGYATEAAQAVKSWCHDERRIERARLAARAGQRTLAACRRELGARLEERIETAVSPTDVWAYLR